jgi:histidinol dehydrogenase
VNPTDLSLIRTLDLRGQRLSKSGYQSKLPRARLDVKTALAQVEAIIDEVRSGDVETLLKISERFDGIRPADIRVPKAKIEDALYKLDPKLRNVIEESIRRVRIVHKAQIRGESTVRVVDGGEVEERWIPVDRVGLYVPAGRAVYPSSVVMNVVPAQLAGVKSIALASPPQKDNDGWPNDLVLATCALLGIDEIYAIGGAQAIAALALGIKNSSGVIISEPVDIVTGPGNIYVAAAKRALRGIVGIDSEAGPTEIAVVADSTAVAGEVAADLISQAEHDTIAAAVLITDSVELKDEVIKELGIRVKRTKHNERITEALSGEQSAIVLVDDLDQALDVANAYAAEHLELLVSDPVNASKKIRNAGAVFLGRYSPVSLGDYLAGSNHVLPTGGCACHSSGLSVQTFLRGLHFVRYNELAFREIASSVVAFAEAEDLPAHGEAIKARFEP